MAVGIGRLKARHQVNSAAVEVEDDHISSRECLGTMGMAGVVVVVGTATVTMEVISAQASLRPGPLAAGLKEVVIISDAGSWEWEWASRLDPV